MKFIQIDYAKSHDFELNGQYATLVATKVPYDKNGNPRYEVKLFTTLIDGSLVVYEGVKKITTYNIEEHLKKIANELNEEGIDQVYE